MDTIAYVSYGADIARSKSRLARDYARAAGVSLRDDSSALTEWRTPLNGGLLATSIGGSLTGQGCQLLLVDDPHKDRAEAESALDRERVYEWFRGTAMTRVEPGGSVIVVHTRWVPDDLAGRLARDTDTTWEVINLPAIDEHGRALWPSRWSVEALEARRREVGEYDWASQYQGIPRPKGGALFGDVRFYEELPDRGYTLSVGLDLAYTAKTHADYSVAVAMMREGDRYFVIDVLREQILASEFFEKLKAEHQTRFAGASWRSYVSSTEKGITDIMTNEGLPVEGVLAKADKFVRAQPVAAAWNAGKILLPRSAPWLSSFVSEIKGFTGVADKHDDQVDALAAAFDVLSESMPIVAATKVRHSLRFGGARGY